MRIFYTGIFIFLFSLVSFGQSQRDLVDSLRGELPGATSLEDEMTLLSELAWNYVPISIDSAILFGERGVQIGKELGDPILLSQIYSDLAYAYMEKGELPSAKLNYEAALALRYELGDSVKIFGTLTNLGSVYQRAFQSDSAMSNYLQALDFFERNGYDRNADMIRNNIGVIYLEMRNYPKALDILKEVVAYRKENGDDYNLAMTYTNLGSIYKNLKEFDLSEKVYLDALGIFKEYDDVYYTATTYNNLATLYNAQKKSELALQYGLSGLELAEQAGASYDYALLESNLAQSYQDLKDFPRSRAYYLRSIAHFKEQNAEADLASMYLLMAPVYAALGMPDSSAFYTEAYIALNKKLTEQEIEKLSTDLETRYQTEKKDLEIASQKLQIRNRTIQLAGSLILALVLGFLGYLLFAQQRLKNRQLQQEAELKTALAQIETQNKLEEQRLLISRDLHDNIGAQLTFIISAIENLKYFDPIKEQLTPRYDTIAGFTKQTIRELRDTIWAMNAGQITWEQLSGRINDYLMTAKASDSKITFRLIGEEAVEKSLRLDSTTGIQIYRIIQEAIQNAMKYAKATEVQVEITQSADGMVLVVRDNGVGFDESEINAGNGLANMRKRAEELNGNLQIKSIPGEGTEVRLSW
ncbi:tetratricopeptide repeat-containing sensor histidine kinase [Algoriphagus namhaensis]